MKKTKMILALLGLIIFTSSAFAQKHNKRGHKMDISKMQEELDLTDEQTLNIIQEQTALRAKMNVIRADEKLTKEERRRQMKQVRMEQKAEIEKILTVQQILKLKEQKEKRKDMQKKRAGIKKEDREALKKYRSDFNSQISKADQKEIARIREIIKERKSISSEQGKTMDRSAFKTAHEKDYESLQQLSDKYAVEIEKYLSTKELKQGDKRSDKSGRRNHTKGSKAERHNKKAIRFLLMDPKEK